jgi:hypothetical protein
MSTVQLDLPAFVHRELKEVAKQHGLSAEKLMVIAIAEKVGALRAVHDLTDPENQRLRERCLAVLSKVPNRKPIKGDELPPEVAEKIAKMRASRSIALQRKSPQTNGNR